jgi:hypothetical protein
MLGKSTNMEPGSTEARLWSRSLACSKAGSECGASAAHGAGRRPAQLTGVMGDGTPWPPKTLETSVKGARLLSETSVKGARLLSPLALLAASAPAQARDASRITHPRLAGCRGREAGAWARSGRPAMTSACRAPCCCSAPRAGSSPRRPARPSYVSQGCVNTPRSNFKRGSCQAPRSHACCRVRKAR